MTYMRIVVVAFLVGLAAYGAYAQQGQDSESRQPDAQRGQQESKMGMKCPMMGAMKGVELHADSPVLLLGRQDALKLTDQQVEELKELVASARRQARQVLTEDQREQLAEVPAGPLSMMEVAMLRMKEIKTSDDESGSMCPMCMKMMKEKMAGKKKAAEQK